MRIPSPFRICLFLAYLCALFQREDDEAGTRTSNGQLSISLQRLYLYPEYLNGTITSISATDDRPAQTFRNLADKRAARDTAGVGVGGGVRGVGPGGKYAQESKRNIDNVPCSKRSSYAKREECLLGLLSVYFGNNMPFECPNAAAFFAVQRCTGCPWDNMSDSKNGTFGKPQDSCAAATFIENRGHLSRKKIFLPMVLSGVLLTLVPLLVENSNKKKKDSLVLPHRGWKEPVSLLTMMLGFNAARISALVPQAYFHLCDTNVGIFLHNAVFYAAYAYILMCLVYRYLRLPSSSSDDADSWLSFASRSLNAENLIAAPALNIRKICVSMIIFLLTGALLLVGAWEVWRESPEIFGFYCGIGAKDGVVYGVLQYTKLFLELVAITAYVFGPQEDHSKRIIRMIVLLVVLMASIVILATQGQFAPSYATTLIPGVVDSAVAYYYLEPARKCFSVRSMNTSDNTARLYNYTTAFFLLLPLSRYDVCVYSRFARAGSKGFDIYHVILNCILNADCPTQIIIVKRIGLLVCRKNAVLLKLSVRLKYDMCSCDCYRRRILFCLLAEHCNIQELDARAPFTDSIPHASLVLILTSQKMKCVEMEVWSDVQRTVSKVSASILDIFALLDELLEVFFYPKCDTFSPNSRTADTKWI